MAQPEYVRNLYLPAAVILIANVLGALHLLPVFVQLLLNSTAVVYAGCISSTQVLLKSGKFTLSDIQSGDNQTIGMKEAIKFPIVASCFLFGIYMIYKYFNADVVTLLITSYFCLTTVFSTAELLVPLLPLPPKYKVNFSTIKVPALLKKHLQMSDIELSVASILAFVLAAIPVYYYFMTKHWALNNVFGILFSIMALKMVNLGNFKVGLLLLWALFFYDIFWVYGTDVMVSVAKKLDIPIKLLFPFLNDQGQEKYSMLGLGDIVLPGIFISLCLKFDIDRSILGKNGKAPSKSASQFKLPYFNLCWIGYVLGICQTFAALYIFDHAQPALLFLVPMCTLTVLAMAAIKGQVKDLLQFDNQKKKQQIKKQIKKEIKKEIQIKQG